MTIKVGKKFRRMMPIYAIFANEPYMTFTEQDAIDAFSVETYGYKPPEPIFRYNNGYHWGKQRLNLAVTSWKEDIKTGYLDKSELYNDPVFKDYPWWLDSVLKDVDLELKSALRSIKQS